jgi:hypothetical protein
MARRPDPAALALAQREGALGGLSVRSPAVPGGRGALLVAWTVEAQQRGLSPDDYRYWTDCEAWIRERRTVLSN